MTIAEMRALVGLPGDASDAAVVAAYAALIDDGVPASITIVEPITVDQVRMHCQLDDEYEDALITQKIRAARAWLEQYTGRVIAQQTLVVHFRKWGGFLELRKRPIISIDAIAYNGAAGDETYEDGAYSIGVYPLRIYPGAGCFPPLRIGGAVTVAYTAGYDQNEVPQCMIEAALILVAGMLGDREGSYAASIQAAKDLTGHLRGRTC